MKIVTQSGNTVEIPSKGLAFTATTSFKLPTPPGGVSPDVTRGESMVFDSNSNLTLQGTTIPCPKFLGAVRAEWVVPSDLFDEDVAHIVQSAQIQMRPAEGGNPMNPKPRHSAVVVETAERAVRNVYDANGKRTAANATPATEADGVVVRHLTTKARADAEQMLDGNISSAMSKTASVRVVPGKGISREDMMSSMSDQERDTYMAKLNSLRGSKEGVAQATTKAVPAVPAPKKSAKAKTQVVAKTPSGGKDSRRLIAKSICADFPDNYDFDLTVKKKIARLQADYDDRPDVIRAVAASETDQSMREAILEEFSEMFG